MNPKKARLDMIDVLEKTIKRFDEIAQQWTEEGRAKGQNPDEDISIGYNRMLVMLMRGWLATMNELLEAEEQIRALTKKRRSKK